MQVLESLGSDTSVVTHAICSSFLDQSRLSLERGHPGRFLHILAGWKPALQFLVVRRGGTVAQQNRCPWL